MTNAAPGDHSEGPLSQLTVLVTFNSSAEHRRRLEESGAHLITCPELTIEAPADYTGLDEAIENLYGYDWLIFINTDSVSFFLTRLQQLVHDTSALDSIKVCAIGEPTATVLEESHVHVDLVCTQLRAAAVIDNLANYLGGRDKLAGLTFVIPQAAIGRDYLKPSLENAGARADVVTAYRTTTASDPSLLRLRTLLISGGVDCVVFTSTTEVDDFARLFDTNDFSGLTEVAVATPDDETAATASTFGLTTTIKPNSRGIDSLVDAISSHFPV